ncbi:hypothetical protein KL948_000773 [Ogataea haglerorum]|nr:hypothetical protein KL948_000773 [Ogataea haglerorum]
MTLKVEITESSTDVEQGSINSRIQIIHKRLLSKFLLDKRIPDIPTDAERKDLPYGTTNIFSEAFFSWCSPILKVGYRRVLVPEDIFKISPGSRYDVGELTAKFEVALKQRIAKSQKQTGEIQRSLKSKKSKKVRNERPLSRFIIALALFDVFRKQILYCVLIRTCGDVSAGMNALQVRKIVEMVSKSSDTSPQPSGYGFAVGIACLVLLQGLAYSHYMIAAQFCGAQIRSVLSHSILQKSMLIDREGKALYPSSKIYFDFFKRYLESRAMHLVLWVHFKSSNRPNNYNNSSCHQSGSSILGGNCILLTHYNCFEYPDQTLYETKSGFK